MELVLTKENPDGSADFDLTLSPLEVQQLVNFGLVEILKKAVEEGKQYVPVNSEASVVNTACGENDCLHGSCIQRKEST